MPAIAVQRTDTFESQRVKINQIGQQIFSITEGGSDLSTGNLKLGDGTIQNPSLAFDNDNLLGLYRPSSGVLGFVSSGKSVQNLSNLKVEVLQDFQLTQNRLQNTGISILNPGSGYEPGDYGSIETIGGSGRSASLNIGVIPYSGTTSNLGSGYVAGSYTGILLQSGNGTGATIDFDVNGLEAGVLVGGSGYAASGSFPAVSLTTVSGTGSGAVATIMTDATGAVFELTFTDQGSGYSNGDVLSANANFDGVGSGGGFTWTLNADPGIITNEYVVNYGTGYQTGDVLTLPRAQAGITTDLRATVTGVSTTLSTSSYQITVADTTGILAGMTVNQGGSDVGQLGAETKVQSVDSATQITLDVYPTVNGAATLTFSSVGTLDEIDVANSDIISVGDTVTQTAGTGVLAANTVVLASANNVVKITPAPTTAGTATLTFTPAFGDPADDYEYTVGNLGVVGSISVSEGGTGYEEGNTLTVSPEDLVQPITYSVTKVNVIELTFTGTVPSSFAAVGDQLTSVPAEGTGVPFDVVHIELSGSNISKLYLDATPGVLAAGDQLENAATTQVTIATAGTPANKFFINTGSGPVMTPDLTLYVGSTYNFDVSSASMAGDVFAFSQYRDGKFSPSLFENLASTLDVTSNQISLSNATGILVGMEVTVTGGTGTLVAGTTVTNVVGNTVTLSRNPLTNGSVTLTFNGTEYTSGVVRTATIVSIKVESSTPTLYYYSIENPDLGGDDNAEATITIDANNPVTFGSGLSVSVVLIDSFAGITGNILTGEFTAITVDATTGEFENLSVSSSGTLTANNINSLAINADSITSVSPNLALNATNLNVTVSGSVDVSGQLSIDGTNGNLTAQGIIKTADSINVNDKLTITNAVIASGASTDIELTPSVGQDVKINSTKSLVIPVGTDLQRPASPVAGAIRFNSSTSQYEGYASNTSSWSSLGGVRDLDGNTYILAEETVGANDNTLYFYNDAQNTIRITPFYQEFVNVKKVRSVNVSAPAHTNWNANSPVSTDDYVKYGNNLFLVVSGGQTGTDANPPTDTSGSDFTNGTATLRYSTTAVAPLTFEEIEEFRIAPLGGTDLAINGDLRLKDNIITTDVNDLSLSPLPGKKVVCDIKTTLVVPVGTTAERGSPSQGSVRFNTTDSLFEGYDGVNWGSLGGVKDVDQNTYIIPETSPGANENILYFYNDGNNTLRLTTTQLEFDTVDTIVSTTSDELEITASLITFDAAATTLDNTLADTTFLHSAKQYFDLGLSSGLYVEPVLRLDNQGDVYFNTTFGTGAYNGVKVFDGDLKEFELADTKILTDKFNLVKGTNNVGTSVIYNNTNDVGAKTIVTAENPTTGDKEFIEFGLLDDGTDVWHTEYGNVRTGAQLIVPTFDISGTNDVRITITLGDAVGVTQTVKVTITNNITKK